MNLFNGLDLGDLVPKKEEKPKVKEEVKQEITEEKKEEIKELVKDVIDENKEVITDSLEDLFNQGQAFEESPTDYVREELEKALKENHTAEFRGITLTIEVFDDNTYDVCLPSNSELSDEDEDNEEMPVPIKGGSQLPNIETAIKVAVDYFFKEAGIKEDKKSKGSKKGSSKKTSTPSTPAKPKEEEKPYEGPRTIKVWGRELWIETDPKVTNDQIREKIATDFGLPEFREGQVLFDLDKTSGILSVGLSFNKRG